MYGVIRHASCRIRDTSGASHRRALSVPTGERFLPFGVRPGHCVLPCAGDEREHRGQAPEAHAVIEYGNEIVAHTASARRHQRLEPVFHLRRDLTLGIAVSQEPERLPLAQLAAPHPLAPSFVHIVSVTAPAPQLRPRRPELRLSVTRT